MEKLGKRMLKNCGVFHWPWWFWEEFLELKEHSGNGMKCMRISNPIWIREKRLEKKERKWTGKSASHLFSFSSPTTSDLDKVLLLPSFGGLPQWAIVGDTFPLGCAFDEPIVHQEFFKDSPDHNNPAYNTKHGVYTEGCGLENVLMSWGHDDYMYLVAKENKTTLPPAALFIIRYYSFYALHKAGTYKHLMNEEDVENLKWFQIFNKYDLYSKIKVRIYVDKVKPYYQSLIEKYHYLWYFPSKLKW
ncbi:unnamed protein product [Coffea canephora]|uniref:Inositol oxygenase n=1 Tax=Coffea canephora TaxID=49390 RepID=A0A068URX0_COFCA|nr:unnamed protein product [Coffea canephora]